MGAWEVVPQWELECCVTVFWCTTSLVILFHASLYKLVTMLYFVTVLCFLGLFITLYATDCEWDWRILFSVDKMMYLVFYLSFFFFFFFFPLSILNIVLGILPKELKPV